MRIDDIDSQLATFLRREHFTQALRPWAEMRGAVFRSHI